MADIGHHCIDVFLMYYPFDIGQYETRKPPVQLRVFTFENLLDINKWLFCVQNVWVSLKILNANDKQKPALRKGFYFT